VDLERPPRARVAQPRGERERPVGDAVAVQDEVVVVALPAQELLARVPDAGADRGGRAEVERRPSTGAGSPGSGIAVASTAAKREADSSSSWA
jgi:hypothetical protein